MKKVYFNVRTSSRERMWDTAREAKRVCSPILPPTEQRSSIERNASYKQSRTKLIRRIKQLIRSLPLLNTQVCTGSKEAELLYLWGAFPKGTTKPYVVELDNPFALTYYNQTAFKLLKPLITRRLRQAQSVTFMSETARNHMLELCGAEFSNHFVALPPFMERNYKHNRRRHDGVVRFLFIGLGFRRKGGPELLEAFHSRTEKNIRLTVVAPVDESIQAQYANDTRISFHPPQSRDALFQDFYPTHDIFIFPSLLETLGVVILEALSFGMGLITTDVYATPELVKPGVNGQLLTHPFLEHTKLNGVSTIDCVSLSRTTFSEQYIQNAPVYTSLVEELQTAIDEATTQYSHWQHASVDHFEATYAPPHWERRLSGVLYGSV